jgi:LuxR family quorum sensing-dependent transcriptional regulator
MDRNEILKVFEAANEIEQAPDLAAVVTRLRASLERFGFTACLAMNLPNQDNKRWHEHVLINEWPPAWYERYMTAGHYRHDPCAARCRTSAGPFVWSEIGYHALEEPAQRVMNEADEFGLREGICIPIHAPFAYPAAVTVAGESVDLAPTARYAVHTLAQYAYHAAARIVRAPYKAAPRLSAREREVLEWTAAGKTAWEVSRILGISENTVGTHLRNAKRKLDTSNVVHTVVEAFRRQEIRL